MLPRPNTTAASFVPSLLEAIAYQDIGEGDVVRLSVHDPPESVDVQMLPSKPTAASFAPPLLEAMADHFCGAPTDLSVHERPESQDVQRPPKTPATSFVPSLLDVIASHHCLPGSTPGAHAGIGVPVGVGVGLGAPTKLSAQAPHFPLFFPGFSEHAHRMVDTFAHFLRSFLPCTAAHASSATAQPAPSPPHRQVEDFLQAFLFRGAHARPRPRPMGGPDAPPGRGAPRLPPEPAP